MNDIPWLEMESYATARQLSRMVGRISKRNRKKLPASAHNLAAACSRIGGKLGRSSVPEGGPVRQLLDRAKALRAAHYVLRRLRDIHRLIGNRDPEIMVAIEVTERVIDLIRIGK